MSEYETLIGLLQKYKPLDSKCDEVFCSTCGGYLYAFKTNCSPTEKRMVLELANKLSSEDFKLLGDWREALKQLFPTFNNQEGLL